MIRRFINYIVRKVSGFLGTGHLANISPALQRVKEIDENVAIERYLGDNLLNNPKYVGSQRITHFHRSVFSQNGEDGIIEEIFRRIGVTDKTFVEFGVHGLKNNSTFLLVKGWRGLWIGANPEASRRIERKFHELLNARILKYRRAWITCENIERIIQAEEIPGSFDLLSIDLDGNDYWIWKAINTFKPRVVSIEYNSVFPADVTWVMKYNESHTWDQTNYFGASLKALELLGTKKGYRLIGCDFAGCNAYFVREDQDLSLFEAPFSAEHHYEPPRFFLRRVSGHPAGFGPFISSI